MADVVPSSTTLAFIKMSEKCKSPSPNAIQVKNQRKANGNEESLDAITWLEQGEWSVDMRRNTSLAHSSICTIGDNAGGIKESSKSESKALE